MQYMLSSMDIIWAGIILLEQNLTFQVEEWQQNVLLFWMCITTLLCSLCKHEKQVRG